MCVDMHTIGVSGMLFSLISELCFMGGDLSKRKHRDEEFRKDMK